MDAAKYPKIHHAAPFPLKELSRPANSPEVEELIQMLFCFVFSIK
jgi:hypothetical protein